MCAQVGMVRGGQSTNHLALLLLVILAAPQRAPLTPSADDNASEATESATCNETLATVVDVDAGHSLRVSIEGSFHTVELSCVDTPAIRRLNKMAAHLGAEAAASPRALAVGQLGCLVDDSETTTPEPRGVLRRCVYLPDGSDLNDSIIASGFGYVYAGSPCARQEEYRELERKARQRAVGLWDLERRASFEQNELGSSVLATVGAPAGGAQPSQIATYVGSFDPYLVSMPVVFSYGSSGNRTVCVGSYHRQGGAYLRSYSRSP